MFFRDSCRRRALAEGLGGSARNLPDGRLEVVLEGEQSAVERVLGWCREGPSGARVTSVEVSDEPLEGHSDFAIH